MDPEVTYLFGPFRLAPAKRTLMAGGKPVVIGSRAFDLLVELVMRAGDVVAASALIERVWPNTVVDPSGLRVHISALRKLLGAAGCDHFVKNVPLRGYCFTEPVQRIFEASSETHIQDSDLDAPRMFTSPVDALSPPLLLMGREAVLEDIAGKLSRRQCITLVGPGGMGKTSVALTVAARLAANFPDGVILLDLAPLTDPAHVTTVLAVKLGLAPQAEEIVDAMRQWMAQRRLLLIVDNCEHLIDALAPLVEQLLMGNANLRVLATSREPLRLGSEIVFRLPPLAFPANDPTDSADALSYPAVALFVHRAAECCDGFLFRDADASLVAEICRRLDGIPLAIELAASSTPAFGLRQIAENLDQRLSLPVHGRRTALPRHQTLRATLDWSFRLLSPTEQSLLMRLSVFRGWFDLQAAEFVGEFPACAAGEGVASPNFSECLHGLFSKSMLMVEDLGECFRYRLLAITRDYARERLQQMGGTRSASERHARYVTAQFVGAAQAQSRHAPALWVERHGHRLDDLRAALDWQLSEDGDTKGAITLVAHSASLWCEMYLFSEFLAYGERALALLRPTLKVPPQDLMRLNEALGHAGWHVRGFTQEMSAAFTRMAELAEQHGALSYRLRATWGHWLISNCSADYVGSRLWAERFGRLIGPEPSQDLAICHMRMMTVGLHLTGDQPRAFEYARKLDSSHTTSNYAAANDGFYIDPRVASLAVGARMQWVRGHASFAAELAAKAVKRAQEIDHPLSICFAISHGAGPIAHWRGDLALAWEYSDLLVTSASRKSLELWVSFGRAFRLAAEVRQGRRPWDASARLEMDESIRASKMLRHYLYTFDSRFVADPECLSDGCDFETWCGSEFLRVQSIHLIEVKQRTKRDTSEALRLLARSIALAHKQQAFAWELRSTTTMAIFLSELGRGQESRERLRAVLERVAAGGESGDVQAARSHLALLNSCPESGAIPASAIADSLLPQHSS